MDEALPDTSHAKRRVMDRALSDTSHMIAGRGGMDRVLSHTVSWRRVWTGLSMTVLGIIVSFL